MGLNKNVRIIVIAVIVLCILLWPVIHQAVMKMLMPKVHMTRPVETAVAVQKDVPVSVAAFGNLTPPEDVNIKSQVSGQITEIHFTDGQDLVSGDLLFLIDPSSYKAELEKAQAQVAQDLADLNLKKSTLERNSKLVQDKLLSQQDFDKYTTDVTQAEAKIKLDTASVDMAKITLDYCYIRSPVSGRAGKRMVDAGNIIEANTGPTLVNIKTVDTMYLDFTIPETDLPLTRAAMANNTLKVEFTVQGDAKNVYSGTLKFLDNSVDNKTGTIMLRAVVDNKERKLWPGQFANIRLILGEEKGAVIVPYDAVQIGPDGPYLYAVRPDNTAELRQVKSGSRIGSEIVIESGVKSGERVVTSGQMGICEGMPVTDTTPQKK